MDNPMTADVVRWECLNPSCLHKGRWWRSAYGVVLCRNCFPPAHPSLVAAGGDGADAPDVLRSYTTTPAPGADIPARPRDPRGELAAGGPVWILRGDRVPEKVEGRGKRRKVEIPADATHWCFEGDPVWTPIEVTAAVVKENARDSRP